MTSLNVQPRASGRGVLAVLGPTNTGKTHLAIERMVAHESGLIGLPLRLLAREVYQRVAEKVGAANVALITGEEKINANARARFQVCTVEAMPDETDAAFVAIDEVQLAGDLERGHVFTDRLLNLRGRQETMLLGAQTVQGVLQELLPGISVVTRPRMSMLTFAGQKKITRLPQRSAIVAFSADEVYAIAELVRRQRGGAAVVLGSLSPRTRNAQVALYQNGDVDYLVATDAIGMGLNLDLDHVAFAQDAKFDGRSHRRLTPAEMGQIAGRAGRHVRNGTFGVTGQTAPFEDDLVRRLETHEFDPVRVLVWRNRDLAFDSVAELRATLEAASSSRLLMKSWPAADLTALGALAADGEVMDAVSGPQMVRMLWDVCQIPDYRRISPGEHASLLRGIFLDLATKGHIDEDWFAAQVARTDRTEGDIDALSARIAHVRTWTYLSHRTGWTSDPVHWQERTRDIEDRLSDALHESLTKRFIDRRTSVLMKRLRENAMLEAEISVNGDVTVEGHHVGSLQGFRFTADASGTGPEAKAAAAAAAKALASEIAKRAERLAAAPNGDIALASDGTLRWVGEPVAKAVGAPEALKPRLVLLADEQLTGPARDLVAARLERWLANHVATLLKPLVELSSDETISGAARGIAYLLAEDLGVLDRRDVADQVQALDQEMRAGLRRHGVRFGAYHIFIPALLKPAPAALLCTLYGLKQDDPDIAGLAELPQLSAAGRTSFPADPAISAEVYRLCGFRRLGAKAVRIDILERLADLIRPALAWRPGASGAIPDGAVDGRNFLVTPAMLSILGATYEDMEAVLKELGYRGDSRLKSEVNAMLAARTPAAAPQTPKGEEEGEETASAAEASAEEAPSQETSPTTEAPGETVASGAADEAAQEGIEPPARVILWRPGRNDRNRGDAGRQQRGQRRGGRQANSQPATAEGTGNPGKRDDAGERGNRGHRGARGENRGESRGDKRGDRRGDRKGPDRKGPDRKGGDAAAQRRNEPPRRQTVDPDSPFAKLAALKAQLEGRDG
jgi:ATP-dependent RNA helicase SUPV3L1/SUV3